MKSRQELRRRFANAPAELIEYACQRQEQLSQRDQLLAEARAYIAELKQQLFGPKADKLTPEQEEQLRQLSGDLQEQAQRAPPLSQQVLEPESPAKDKEKPKRPRRQAQPPVKLEVHRQLLEPEDKHCAHCQRERPRIGEEITTEYDYQPAKLLAQQTVRPKYGQCPCGCGKTGVAIAPLPPRLSIWQMGRYPQRWRWPARGRSAFPPLSRATWLPGLQTPRNKSSMGPSRRNGPCKPPQRGIENS